MALKPGPAVKVKVTVSGNKKKGSKGESIPYLGNYDIPAGYEAVEIKGATAHSNGEQISIYAPDQMLMIETGYAVPQNIKNKSFYLSSAYRWELVMYHDRPVLVPLKKSYKKAAE